MIRPVVSEKSSARLSFSLVRARVHTCVRALHMLESVTSRRSCTGVRARARTRARTHARTHAHATEPVLVASCASRCFLLVRLGDSKHSRGQTLGAAALQDEDVGGAWDEDIEGLPSRRALSCTLNTRAGSSSLSCVSGGAISGAWDADVEGLLS